MGYYRKSEGPPPKPYKPKPKIEPWVCGRWCNGCIYARHITSGYSCAYYEETGLHRREDEPTKECSVRVSPRALNKKETGPGRVVGPAGEGLLTYRQIGQVVQKINAVVCNWAKYRKGLGTRVNGFRGMQLTVDEAVALAQGHEYELTTDSGALNETQKELLRRLREISKG